MNKWDFQKRKSLPVSDSQLLADYWRQELPLIEKKIIATYLNLVKNQQDKLKDEWREKLNRKNRIQPAKEKIQAIDE